MKKTISIIITLIALLTLTACGNDATKSNADNDNLYQFINIEFTATPEAEVLINEDSASVIYAQAESFININTIEVNESVDKFLDLAISAYLSSFEVQSFVEEKVSIDERPAKAATCAVKYNDKWYNVGATALIDDDEICYIFAYYHDLFGESETNYDDYWELVQTIKFK